MHRTNTNTVWGVLSTVSLIMPFPFLSFFFFSLRLIYRDVLSCLISEIWLWRDTVVNTMHNHSVLLTQTQKTPQWIEENPVLLHLWRERRSPLTLNKMLIFYKIIQNNSREGSLGRCIISGRVRGAFGLSRESSRSEEGTMESPVAPRHVLHLFGEKSFLSPEQ